MTYLEYCVLDLKANFHLFKWKPTVRSLLTLSPTQLCVPCFPQMAAGVRHMHKLGLIHRDIKAENFVFAESPAVSR